MKGTLWVFDFDHTIIEPNPNFEIKLSPNGIDYKFCHHQTSELLNYLLANKKDVYILTSRHPCMKEHIANFLHTPNIICRDFALDIEDYNNSFNNIIKKANFLSNMILFKQKELTKLAEEYEVVFFIDDYADEFRYSESNPKQNDLPINIYPILPFHMCRSNTVQGALLKVWKNKTNQG